MRNPLNYCPAPASPKRWLWVLAVVACVAASAVAYRHAAGPGGGGAGDPLFYPVARRDFEISLRQDGELEAVDNLDVLSPVPGESTLLYIAPEGTLVRRGDRLFEIDASATKTQLDQAKLDVHKAESDLTAAREQREIQSAKGAAAVKTAGVELRLAELMLTEYAEGEYPKLKATAERELRTATSELADKQEYFIQTQSLYAKGFTTASDLKKAQAERENKQSALEEKQVALDVLVKYTHERETADRANKVSEARSKQQTARSEAASEMNQHVAAEQAATDSLAIRAETLKGLEGIVAACVVRAPGPGIVLYATSVGVYYNSDGPLRAGSKVMGQQLVVRLPDVGAMKAVVMVDESRAITLRADPDHPMRARVKVAGVEGPLAASVTRVGVLPDNQNRYFNPDLKEYPVDLTLDATPTGLKPGLAASTTILVDRVPDTIAVPFAAVYSEGERAWAFVRTPAGGLEAREVELGRSNATHVQVLGNLREGEEVRLLGVGEGRTLLDRLRA